MRLWLLRHAKSSWEDTGIPDEERPLAPRGQQAADRMRDYLVAEGIEPQLVLCSSAVRARETLARVLPGLGSELQMLIEPELYTFDAEVLLHRLYTESFDFLRTGYGAALTVVYLAVVMLLTRAQARMLDRRVHYTCRLPGLDRQ